MVIVKRLDYQKDFEFEGISEVIMTKDGESIILTPKRKSWDSFFSGGMRLLFYKNHWLSHKVIVG
ncbi:MAG: hypothetical protein L3J52_02860 [Proteobacteria bacterium]|nr:hypothetical protein [Pseudomonadota bacterium]